MAETTRSFAFRRNTSFAPFIIPVGVDATPLQIGSDMLRSKGITTFKITNACPFYIWYRGWNGLQSAMPTIKGKGHYLAPGATDVNSSQIPDWIAAVADEERGFPLFDESAQFIYEGQQLRAVMLYGSGM